MSTNRLEAFSDGVIAIIITIMVLEFKVPHGVDWHALQGLSGVASSYVMSFVYIGIYWNNHHHIMQTSEKVNGTILWANLHLLFWLSLVPFTTGWMGENGFATLPGRRLWRRSTDQQYRVSHFGIRLDSGAAAQFLVGARLSAGFQKAKAPLSFIASPFRWLLSIAGLRWRYMCW